MNKTRMKTIALLLALCFTTIAIFAKEATLSGYVKDKNNGEALIGATVFVSDLNTGVVSNPYGFYSVSLPTGSYTIVYSYMGYQSQTQKIMLKENQQLTIMLSESVEVIDEVVVTGDKKNHNVESIDLSTEKIPVKMVKKLPSFMGEVDVMKSIQLLPGIQSGGEASSGLYVRGGGPDENLLLLDESPVYNASHLMGFFSVFNSDAINEIQVYKGGIPAEYGGKASSVIDVRMKDGNSQKFEINGGIGNISSRLTLEGPIIKDKWSFILSGRRTYADVVGRTVGIEALKENDLYFYDLNGKTNFQLGKNDRFYISTYSGDDYFSLGESLYMRWGNLTTTARWNHLFGEKLFLNTSVIYSKYRYNLGVPGDDASQFDWSSSIRDCDGKLDFTWYLSPQNQVNFGINSIYHHFEPGQVSVNENSYFNDLTLTQYNAVENAAYVSNEQKVGEKLTLQYGIRYSLFQQVGKGKVREYINPEKPESDEIVDVREYGPWELIGPSYANFEPRFSVKYSLDGASSVKASYNRMVQNLHLISNTNSPTPLDIWLPSSRYIKPLLVDQYVLGYFRNLYHDMFETSLELYYKDMQNVIDYVDGAQLFLNENIETELLRGKGYSYGMEVLLKKNEGNLTGWIGYTMSRTMREIAGINEGKAYPSSYDHTHDLSVVLNYEFNSRWNVSGSWVYTTGNPVSYPAAKYLVQGNVVYYYSARNSNRIPDYHRMDISVTYNYKKNQRRRYKQSLNLSLYNVYARRNAYSVTFRENADNPNISEAVRLSIIGTVIPSLTYNFTF
jgi:hypothetical protein